MRLTALSLLFLGVFCATSCESGTGPQSTAVSRIEVAGAPDTVVGGQTFRLTARALNASGAEIPAQIVWSTSDSAIASVSADGFVVPSGIGPVTMTATVGAAVGRASFVVVSAFIPASFSVTKPAGMLVEDTLRLRAYISGSHVDPTLKVSWTSLAPAVATVDSAGLVHSLALGTAVIVAQAGSLADTARVAVTSLSGITLQADRKVVAVGDTIRFAATAYGAPANSVIVHTDIAYSTSDTNIATVDAGGLVHARSSGVVTITATARGISTTQQLTAYRVGAVTACAGAGTVEMVGASGPQTWTRAGSPHHLPASISFSDTLTIEPGAVVCFAPSATLSVSVGVLIARGTPAAPILFTAEDSTSRWGGISLGAGTSRISNATIEYAVVGVRTSSVAIDSVHVRQSGYGVSLSAALESHVAFSVFDTCGIGILTTGGTLVQNVIRGAGTGISLGGGTGNAGDVEIFGGRIEGSKGLGLYAGEHFRQASIVGGSPVRIVGGGGAPAVLSPEELTTLYPTLADQDSLLGNAKDEVGLTYGFAGREMVITPKLAWSVSGINEYGVGFTVGAGGVLRMLPGAKLTLVNDNATRFKDGGRLIAVGNSAQPVTIVGSRIEFSGAAPDTSFISNARLDSISILSSEAHTLLIDSTLVTAVSSIVLASPASMIANSTLDGGFNDFRYSSPASLVLGARGVRADRVKVRGSVHDGIRISAADVTLTNCEVSGSKGDGISATEAGGVRINDCNILNNAGVGVRNTNTSFLDATQNWWGDPIGPNGPAGDGVAGNVAYEPVRTSPVTH